MNFHLTPTSTNHRPHEAKFELFRLRLIARLCVALVCLIQFLSRMATIHGLIKDVNNSQYLSLLLLPFTPMMLIVVIIEYALFKKKGPRILKYSQVVEIVLLLLFTGEWIAGIFAWLGGSIHLTTPGEFPISTVFGFAGFGWRTLLMILLVQKWQLKIIAPCLAMIVLTGLTFKYDSEHFYVYVIRCAAALFTIVFIIYFENKIKWMMIWNNIQQEKWMQVNNFILNSIPENIIILDSSGEAKFTSDSCRNFLEKCELSSLSTQDFFRKIQDLKEQKSDSGPETGQAERVKTEDDKGPSSYHIEALTDLITNFKNLMKEKSLQERQFLIYNGKLKMENFSQEKSIEIKISFVRHFENDYVILILRDTTQRDLLIAAEETNKYKDQLLASVSHELRAPLNGNINLVETAVNSLHIPGHIKDTLLIPALRSSKFLLHIINDILDMSQIKEKKLRLVFQSGDLKETIKSTAQLIEFQAKKKGIELLLEFDPNLPDKFCTDHIRLSQIVLNLLNNAMKFTNEGAIKLTAEPFFDWVKINIEDSGIGISEENLKKLFSNYTHIEFEGRQAMNPTGVGLGLNIAHNLVQLLAPKDHQTITVVSVPNQGSTFSFILESQENNSVVSSRKGSKDDLEEIPDKKSLCPIADEFSGEDQRSTLNFTLHSRKRSEIEPLLNSPSCLCPRILIVDDNPFNTMAFETILGSLDTKCDSVYSGSSAIKMLLCRESKKCGKDCKQYSVIFMDQEMPEMNGIETVREIRRLQEEKLLSKEMRIIGCTAHHSKEEVDKFVESGLDGCIHKPISVQMIQEIL